MVISDSTRLKYLRIALVGIITSGVALFAAISRRRAWRLLNTPYFGRLWYDAISDAVEYVKFYSSSHDAVIRVYDEAGNVVETQKHTGDFERVVKPAVTSIAFSNSSLISVV